jgi:glycine/D-amino acid oxidase-like deaminating enzyme
LRWPGRQGNPAPQGIGESAKVASFYRTPQHGSYDVVVIGGAMLGSAVAWFLTRTGGFEGRVLVVERDASFAKSATAHSNSCIRQQFSTRLNVEISRFGAAFINSFPEQMGFDPRVPDLSIHNFGYLYLAGTDAGAEVLRRNHAVQSAAGAATRLMAPDEIARDYPFYALDDIVMGSINTVDEGYWDGGTVFDWWRRSAREAGAEYVENEVVAIDRRDGRAVSVTLASGETVACGTVVNAAGTRAAHVAAMAGLDLPVEPRKRMTWVFSAERPLDRDLPLTIDPCGVHVRQDGPGTYMAGSAGFDDPAVDPDDFTIDPDLWLDKVWPAIAARIPQFEAIRVIAEWAGHYDYNVFDQNAVIGPHPDLPNFLFVNGFSGHGLQQSPAMGRGVAEWITQGSYQTLDLTPFHYDRLLQGVRVVEEAVI